MCDDQWNKATKLEIAGLIAPVLRGQSESVAKRRVAKVDKDGNVVGYTTLAELQRELLAARKIELEVEDGVRPEKKLCEKCGIIFEVPKVGALPSFCRKCSDPACIDCGKIRVRAGQRHEGSPLRCRDCHKKTYPTYGPIHCAICGSARKRKGRPTSKKFICMSCKRVDVRTKCCKCGGGMSRTYDSPSSRARRPNGNPVCGKCRGWNASQNTVSDAPRHTSKIDPEKLAPSAPDSTPRP